MKELEYTGEFLVPGRAAYETVQEHVARYLFASAYVKRKSVLDLACGTGYGAALLRSRDAATVIGVDISTEVLEFARIHYQTPGVSFARANALFTPFPAASFDVAVSFETIEHLDNPAGFLDEIRRLLRPGGVFICSSPNKRVYSLGLARPVNPYHVREFTTREFRHLLSAAFNSQIRMFAQRTMNLKQRLVYELLYLDFRLPGTAPVFRQLRENSRTVATADSPAVGLEPEVEPHYRVGPFHSTFWRQATFIIAVCTRE